MSEPKASPKLKSVENFKKAESALLFVLWVVVAVLEMKRIRLGLVTSYGADLFMPAWLYVVAVQGKTLFRFLGLGTDRPVLVAGIVFGFCVAWELGQKIHWIPGVFDPLDIVAYAVGVGGVLLIDLWLKHVAGPVR